MRVRHMAHVRTRTHTLLLLACYILYNMYYMCVCVCGYDVGEALRHCDDIMRRDSLLDQLSTVQTYTRTRIHSHT